MNDWHLDIQCGIAVNYLVTALLLSLDGVIAFLYTSYTYPLMYRQPLHIYHNETSFPAFLSPPIRRHAAFWAAAAVNITTTATPIHCTITSSEIMLHNRFIENYCMYKRLNLHVWWIAIQRPSCFADCKCAIDGSSLVLTTWRRIRRSSLWLYERPENLPKNGLVQA